MAETAIADFRSFNGRQFIEIIDTLAGEKFWASAVGMARPWDLILTPIGTTGPWVTEWIKRSSSPGQRLSPLIELLRSGEARIEADGDYSSSFSALTVPAGFWKVGAWCLERRGDCLVALKWEVRIDADGKEWCGWTEAPPAYFNPRLTTKVRAKSGEVKRIAVALLEEHQTELVRTNGLIKAAAAIRDMIEMEKPVGIDMIRKIITPRYEELRVERGIERSPTSPKSKQLQ
jgi:hypothetical protein